jgi:sugar phosphate permease
MSLPLVFYFQIVRGLTPTQSALMLVPMAVLGIILAPIVGRIIDHTNPRNLAIVGLVLLAVALVWYSFLLKPDTPIWLLLLPSAVLGFANAGIWAPISNTATRNLPREAAGAGSGVFNTTRQVGAVLGSAGIAVLIQGRLAAELPGGAGSGSGASEFGGGTLPAFLQDGFATAMAQSLLLPAGIALVGAVIVVFFAKPKANTGWGAPAPAAATEEAATPRA